MITCEGDPGLLVLEPTVRLGLKFKLSFKLRLVGTPSTLWLCKHLLFLNHHLLQAKRPPSSPYFEMSDTCDYETKLAIAQKILDDLKAQREGPTSNPLAPSLIANPMVVMPPSGDSELDIELFGNDTLPSSGNLAARVRDSGNLTITTTSFAGMTVASTASANAIISNPPAGAHPQCYL